MPVFLFDLISFQAEKDDMVLKHRFYLDFWGHTFEYGRQICDAQDRTHGVPAGRRGQRLKP